MVYIAEQVQRAIPGGNFGKTGFEKYIGQIQPQAQIQYGGQIFRPV